MNKTVFTVLLIIQMLQYIFCITVGPKSTISGKSCQIIYYSTIQLCFSAYLTALYCINKDTEAALTEHFFPAEVEVRQSERHNFKVMSNRFVERESLSN